MAFSFCEIRNKIFFVVYTEEEKVKDLRKIKLETVIGKQEKSGLEKTTQAQMVPRTIPSNVSLLLRAGTGRTENGLISMRLCGKAGVKTQQVSKYARYL